MGNGLSLDLTGFSRELRLILILTDSENDDGEVPGSCDSITDIDWNLFLQLAKHHRLYPLISARLQKLDEGLIPQFVIQTLRNEYCRNTFQMLYLSRELERICRSFSENDVKLFALRGPILAADLYGDISLRTSVDLDLFVSLKDLDQVDILLSDLGYVKHDFFSTTLDEWKWRIHHLNYVHPKTKIKLEIHWRLNPYPGPGKEPEFDELWERKRTSSLMGDQVYYFGREDLFLLLVTHGARHGWSRLGWLADIDRIARQKLDWSKLNRLLKKHQCLHIGGQALILASQLFNTPITDDMKVLELGRRPRRLAQEALFYIKQMVNLHDNPLPEVSKYHERHLFALMSNRQRFLFVMSFFYPYPMDAEILPLPKCLHFLYLPLRPFLWILRKTRERCFNIGG